MLSASANKLSRLQEQAEEYAALIMEELDPERLGYIEVRVGSTFLFYIFSTQNYLKKKLFFNSFFMICIKNFGF